jgi:hypothetical protein
MVEYGTQKSAPVDRVQIGPFDLSELITLRPSLDFGALQLPMREDVTLKLEVDESSSRIVALTVEHQGSAIQLQAFSAPGSAGIWHEIRRSIDQSILSQGGNTETVLGPLGPELNAQIPTRGGGFRVAKFIGVDGPKWFLRGVISGLALSDALAMTYIIEIFRSVVVVRGISPMPPKELLQLTAPVGAKKVNS